MPNGKPAPKQRTKAEKAARAAETRKRLGVVNPFSPSWKPTEPLYKRESHPALKKV